MDGFTSAKTSNPIYAGLGFSGSAQRQYHELEHEQEPEQENEHKHEE
jgi:hypothetical protein